MRFWSYGTHHRGEDLRSLPPPPRREEITLATRPTGLDRHNLAVQFRAGAVLPRRRYLPVGAPGARWRRGRFMAIMSVIHISPPVRGCPRFPCWAFPARHFPASSWLPLHNGHFISILIDYTSFSTSNHHNKNCLVDDRQIVVHFNGYDKQGRFFSVR